MHVSTQVPHQVRSAVAQAFGVAEHRVRVIAPDVGGGFGLKRVACWEEVTLAGYCDCGCAARCAGWRTGRRT